MKGRLLYREYRRIRPGRKDGGGLFGGPQGMLRQQRTRLRFQQHSLGRKSEGTVKKDRSENRSTSDSLNGRLRKLLSKNRVLGGGAHTC